MRNAIYTTNLNGKGKANNFEIVMLSVLDGMWVCMDVDVEYVHLPNIAYGLHIINTFVDMLLSHHFRPNSTLSSQIPISHILNGFWKFYACSAQFSIGLVYKYIRRPKPSSLTSQFTNIQYKYM